MSFNENFVKINENKVVCIWKFKKKWEKLKLEKGYHVSKFYFNVSIFCLILLPKL